MEPPEEGSILQNATDGKEFGETLLIDFASGRQDGEQGFRLGSKVKGVGGLVAVDPIETITIVEEDRAVLTQIDQQSGEAAVELAEERGTAFFVEMDERG